MARPEPPQAVLNSLQLLQEPRAVLNLVQAVLNSLQHLQEPRAVLNSLLSLGAQVNDLWTASVLHSLAAKTKCPGEEPRRAQPQQHSARHSKAVTNPQQQCMKHHAPVTRPVLHSLVQGAVSVAAPACSSQQRASHGGPQRAPARHGRHTPMRRRVLHSLAYPPSGSESLPS